VERSQLEKTNEAAKKFAEAVRESYEAVAESALSVQQLNAQLVARFFDQVRKNLEESRLVMGRPLAAAQESQRLAQESLRAYMDFLDTMLAYHRSPLSAQEIAERGREIYEREIRERVEEEHAGAFLVIDVTTGDYEIADDDLTASDRALAKNPRAIIYGLRIGEPAAYKLRNHTSDVSGSAAWP
jgi:hypothetical protein